MSQRLTIIGALSLAIGVGCIAVPFGVILEQIPSSKNLRLVGRKFFLHFVSVIVYCFGSLLILVGVILIGWQICSNNHNDQRSSKRKKVLKTK